MDRSFVEVKMDRSPAIVGTVAVLALMLLSLEAPAFAQSSEESELLMEEAQPQSDVDLAVQPEARGRIGEAATTTSRTVMAEEVTARAKIISVDQAKRELTLQGDGGNTFKVRADASAGDLAKVNAGDMIIARYLDSVAVSVEQPGHPSKEAANMLQMPVRPAKQRPDSLTASVITHRATVQNVDAQNSKITVRGDDGHTKTLSFDPSAGNLANIKAGDTINVRHTEAVALDIVPMQPSTMEQPAAQAPKGEQDRSSIGES